MSFNKTRQTGKRFANRPSQNKKLSGARPASERRDRRSRFSSVPRPLAAFRPAYGRAVMPPPPASRRADIRPSASGDETGGRPTLTNSLALLLIAPRLRAKPSPGVRSLTAQPTAAARARAGRRSTRVPGIVAGLGAFPYSPGGIAASIPSAHCWISALIHSLLATVATAEFHFRPPPKSSAAAALVIHFREIVFTFHDNKAAARIFHFLVTGRQ